MRIISAKAKGQRAFKSVTLITISRRRIKRPFFLYPLDGNLWFCLEKGEWMEGCNGNGQMTSSYYAMKMHGFNNAYSLKAVIRLVSKWKVPKGTRFKASLPLTGHDFYITK